MDHIEETLADDTAGDPTSDMKWTRRTTAKVAALLARQYEILVSDRTVARLMIQRGFALLVNQKKLAGADHPLRDDQFQRIAELRARSAHEDIPIISIDTRKKELVGRFRNPGAKWGNTPELAHDHDFPSDAEGTAVPYGIYDMTANTGSFFVGKSYNTPEFAAECVAQWWETEGQTRYPEAKELIILADSGGSNGCRPHAWKNFLQHRLANAHNLKITLAHYPTGTSKWNPIEHRLFSEVSKKWAGVPLETYEVILNYLKTTSTSTDLMVRATLVEREYEKGIKIEKSQMELLNIEKDSEIPNWNYTIRPQAEEIMARCLCQT